MGLFVWDSEPSKIFVGDTAISKVFLWDTQVRPTWWQPWANTVAYYPLTSTTTTSDESGNNRNLTNSWASFWVYQNVDSCYVNWRLYCNWISNPSQFTLNCRYCMRATSEHYYLTLWLKDWTWADASNLTILWEFNGRPNWSGFWIQYNWTAYEWLTNGTKWTLGVWYNGVGTYDWTTLKIYLNWALQKSVTTSITSVNTILLGYGAAQAQVNVSNAIVENIARTAEEIQDYYNYTKSNYWIS